MPYLYAGLGASFFASVTRDVGGSDYYKIPAAIQNFASICNATLTTVAQIPDGLGLFGSIECNTNTGDLASEAAVTVNFFSEAASSLLTCVMNQAHAFQGDNSCNPDEDPNGVWYGMTSVVLFFVCVCYCNIKNPCDKRETKEAITVPSGDDETRPLILPV